MTRETRLWLGALALQFVIISIAVFIGAQVTHMHYQGMLCLK